MSIYTIADTHLSFSTDKPMNIFRGWDDYVERLEKNWRNLVKDEDTVIIGGDISWALRIEETVKDFEFLDSLPGKKIILKGNHDYWWQTKKKLDAHLERHNFSSLSILFNNAFKVEDFVVCGSRGWFFDDDNSADKKILNREAGRLRMSIEQAKKLTDDDEKIIVFLHYPPVTLRDTCEEIMSVLKENNIKRVYYGHLHGPSLKNAVTGDVDGIKFRLCSADYLSFCPLLVEK